LRADNGTLREEVAQLLKKRLAVAVVIDEDKQAELADVGQACGVTLSQCLTILEAMIPAQAMSRATLGRRRQALGQKAGELLKVLDEFTQERVRDVAADEIYVRDPVLMVVEQESLCWVAGKLSEEVTGKAWFQGFKQLLQLEQVARDAGSALAKGVELVNTQRQTQDAEPKETSIVDQGDHFHALRDGGVGLRRFQRRASAALAKAEDEQKALETCARVGKKQTGPAVRAGHVWRQVEEAMDAWIAIEKAWQRTKSRAAFDHAGRRVELARRPGRRWRKSYRCCRGTISPRPNGTCKSRRAQLPGSLTYTTNWRNCRCPRK
jgi:hypothetical protein